MHNSSVSRVLRLACRSSQRFLSYVACGMAPIDWGPVSNNEALSPKCLAHRVNDNPWGKEFVSLGKLVTLILSLESLPS